MKKLSIAALGVFASLTLAVTGAQATTYTTDPFNGLQPGGSQDNPSNVSAFGQYFASANGGVLSALSFLDSDSTTTGTRLIVRTFDTATMAAGTVDLFNGSGTISGFGDQSFADGNGGYVDFFYRHSFTFPSSGSKQVVLTPGQAYIAYLVDAPGKDTFNGSTTYGITLDDDGNILTDPPTVCYLGGCDEGTPVGVLGNGTYAFGLGKYDTALGGAEVRQTAGGAFIQTANPTPGQSIFFQADFAITIDPLAAAVPEAGTWGMMIAGFGLAGVALRRRRTTVAFA
ncbi:PEPxxWA-CTERM sorting domain-containing protein [Sphingomonas bacterium]|uniref:PEPxxWA-CTERM sorting domain-containing protein n=1 Tax=Sphingomonas bacterium TaxID=1895847 RepID=UPI0020C5E971|nr:PEPxxWA-CTERM sorting domain-containing protein [Sphingomonas bacterium]